MSTETATTTLEKYLASVKASATAYIASADTKATALLTVAAALLALMTALGSATPQATHFETGLLVIYALALAASVGCSSLVLWPRTDRAKYLAADAAKSITFFGDVSATGLGDFRNFCNGPIPTKKIDEDEIEQTFIAARIATVKLEWMRGSVIALSVSLGALLALVLKRLFAL